MTEKFWSRVDKSGGANACWPWTGSRLPTGYGQVYQAGGQRLLAHRTAWELENGPIPDGMRVLHHCDNPPCCNPGHLFLGTDADNMNDRDQKGHNANSRKTNCPHLEATKRETQANERGGQKWQDSNLKKAR